MGQFRMNFDWRQANSEKSYRITSSLSINKIRWTPSRPRNGNGASWEQSRGNPHDYSQRGIHTVNAKSIAVGSFGNQMPVSKWMMRWVRLSTCTMTTPGNFREGQIVKSSFPLAGIWRRPRRIWTFWSRCDPRWADADASAFHVTMKTKPTAFRSTKMQAWSLASRSVFRVKKWV